MPLVVWEERVPAGGRSECGEETGIKERSSSLQTARRKRSSRTMNDQIELRTFVDDYIAKLRDLFEDGLEEAPTVADVNVNSLPEASYFVEKYIDTILRKIANGDTSKEQAPPLHKLAIGCVQCWKESIEILVSDDWVSLFINADFYNTCPTGFSIVSFPNCENWCIDKRLLSIGGVERQELTVPFWDDVVRTNTVRNCIRPNQFYNGCLLRKVAEAVHFDGFSENNRRTIKYGVRNLPYELQLNMVECCRTGESDIAVEELANFLKVQSSLEMPVFGANTLDIICFDHFALTSTKIYVYANNSR